MKRFFKILGVILVIFIAAIILLPILFKDEIIARAKTEINKQIEAEVNFEDIDISLFSTFPNFNLGITKFTIDGKGNFAGQRLASIGDFDVELNLFSVMQGDQFEVEGISISDAEVNVIVDKDGNANYDIAKASEETEETPADTASSSFKLKLKSFTLNNFNLVYDDREGNIKAVIRKLDFNGSGDLSEEVVDLKTNTKIEDLTVRMDGVDYLSHTKAFADMDVEFNQPQFKITLKENTIGLNDLRLALDGYVALPTDDIEMDLKMKAPQSEFKSVLSLVPTVFLEGFETVKTTGTFSLDGFVKGIYNGENEVYPSFDFNFLVNDGTFRYPDLPAGVTNINVEAHIKNPSNTLDATEVNIPKASCNIANSPFMAVLNLKTPISDPQFKGQIKTDLQLKNLGEVVPSSDFDYSGRIKGDVTFAGKMSDVDNENYEAVTLAGNMVASNITLKSDSLPFPIVVSNAEMNFTPQQVNLPSLQMQLGKSDFAANGKIDNILAYMLQDSTLKAVVNLNSTMLDLNQLFAAAPSGGEETTENTEQSTPMEAIRLPENINFTLTSQISKILYDNLEINDLQGVIALNKGVAQLRDVTMKLLSGEIAMDGSYNSVLSAPEAKFDFKIKNFNFKETYEKFVSFEKLAPIMKTATGNFSTGFSFTGNLNPDMSPDLSTVLANGALQTDGLSVAPKSLEKLASALKNPSLSKLDIGKVNLSFMVEDGRVKVEPFDFTAGNVKATVSGSNGLDQTLDYKMNIAVPVSGISAADILSKIGASQSGKVDVAVLIGGTVTDPTVKTSLGDMVNNVLDNLKNQAKEKIEEVKTDAINKVNEEAKKLIDDAEAKGNQLIAEAEKQAANIKAEAKKQANVIRTEGEKQATKLEADAKGNILKEQGARIAAKKLREEAQDKANKLESEAAKRADALVDKARAQKESLVADAREKGNISNN